MACDRPPIGWYCTRSAGHAGPCAARPWSLAPRPNPEPADLDWFEWFVLALIVAIVALLVATYAAVRADRPVLKTAGFENTRNFLISPARSGRCCAVPGGLSRQRLIAPPPAAIAAIAPRRARTSGN